MITTAEELRRLRDERIKVWDVVDGFVYGPSWVIGDVGPLRDPAGTIMDEGVMCVMLAPDPDQPVDYRLQIPLSELGVTHALHTQKPEGPTLLDL